jgi:hypothetical protein
MKILKKLIIWIVVIFLAIIGLMLLPSPQPDAEKPWEVTVMPDGNSQVLGIHLGTTDYQTAQAHFKQYGQSGLFEDKDGTISVEAFFESINLAGLSAKVVLNLDVNEVDRQNMLSRAISSELKPSQAHMYELAQVDREAIITAPIIGLTYIPSVRLSEDMISSRFGEPASQSALASSEGSSIKLWQYPALNLTVQFEEGRKTLLIYQSK